MPFSCHCCAPITLIQHRLRRSTPTTGTTIGDANLIFQSPLLSYGPSPRGVVYTCPAAARPSQVMIIMST
ncbi:hypothetical protein Syun_016962 [Stephania yunnanensis]|uniref:Uncharacterized protein n=1 Tax=Stephania yunnanensis TaxID=152371 RepID=A0AAP0J6Z7_9MAGN